jgi:hypothetical protein
MKDATGRELPVHACAPRSDMARKLVTICKLHEGPWQFASNDLPVSFAIRFCPFCGDDLTDGKPYLRSH